MNASASVPANMSVYGFGCVYAHAACARPGAWQERETPSEDGCMHVCAYADVCAHTHVHSDACLTKTFAYVYACV